ncbi:hypothetical protein HK096_010525 [Nowakowskiella sp. JEL0078]|nr:hypothetical protein HK096_010525 [Nowakowskiella sp. JEL0078]
MSSNIAVKIFFNGVTRKFVSPSSITWNQFENKIRESHSISKNLNILVTYKDEDGDVIALDTDRYGVLNKFSFNNFDFRELSDLFRITKGNYVNFEVNIRENDSVSSNSIQSNPEKSSDNDLKEYVPVLVSSNSIQSNPEKSSDNDLEEYVPVFKQETPEINLSDSSKYVHVTETETSDTSSVHTTEEKGKTRDFNSENNNEAKPNQSESKTSFESFLDGVNPVIEQLEAEFKANPEFVDRVSDLMSQIAEQTQNHLQPVLVDIFRSFNGSSCGPFDYSHDPRSYIYGQPQFSHPINGSFINSGQFHPCFGYKARRFPNSPCGNKNFYYNQSEKANDENTSSEKTTKPESQKISEETFQKLIKQVQDMGFRDEEVISDLLRRYDGNVERVVDLILRQ